MEKVRSWPSLTDLLPMGFKAGGLFEGGGGFPTATKSLILSPYCRAPRSDPSEAAFLEGLFDNRLKKSYEDGSVLTNPGSMIPKFQVLFSSVQSLLILTCPK